MKQIIDQLYTDDRKWRRLNCFSNQLTPDPSQLANFKERIGMTIRTKSMRYVSILTSKTPVVGSLNAFWIEPSILQIMLHNGSFQYMSVGQGSLKIIQVHLKDFSNWIYIFLFPSPITIHGLFYYYFVERFIL